MLSTGVLVATRTPFIRIIVALSMRRSPALQIRLNGDAPGQCARGRAVERRRSYGSTFFAARGECSAAVGQFRPPAATPLGAWRRDRGPCSRRRAGTPAARHHVDYERSISELNATSACASSAAVTRRGYQADEPDNRLPVVRMVALFESRLANYKTQRRETSLDTPPQAMVKIHTNGFPLTARAV